MNRTQIISATLLALSLAACPPETPDLRSAEASAASDFHALLDEHWTRSVEEKIYFRSDPDAWRMDGPLSEHTPEARERRREFNELMLERLASIDEEGLEGEDRISYRLFKYERETERDSYSYNDHRFPFTSLFGYHTYFAEAPANMSFLTAEDYDNYLVSLADFTRYNRERVAELREGVETGYTHYCESITDYARTIEAHIVSDATESGLFVPFESFPSSIDEPRRAEYTAKGAELIQDVVVPGYRKLDEFFRTEYLPNCREEVGITALEGGDDYYQYLIRYFTTTSMTPQEIHDLGLAEVERIRAEMQAILESVGFEGDMRAFLEYLRTEPSFYAKSIPELLGRAALISKTAEGELPRFFTVLPRGTYKISANPSRGTFYMPSSGDGTTSGTYFVGTDSLDAQPLYTLEALTLHEGVPGHHLQSALAMELGLPEFRRTLYHSAFGEGWGLYSERLGKEMGFYRDPYSDFGRLSYEMWRAVRLVVDTGMHAFGWSRRQGMDFMLANTAASELETRREIDRYITWPAQALSYKIGELRIREMRARAESELGSDFDLREFHDTVVGHGSLPIDVLQSIVDDWVSSRVGV
jgi:uncharacterized protein (DUF885 family)